MEINISENLAQSAEEYAEKAGSSVESLISMALSAFIRNDVLGISDSEIKRLETNARKLELEKRIRNASGKPADGASSEPPVQKQKQTKVVDSNVLPAGLIDDESGLSASTL